MTAVANVVRVDRVSPSSTLASSHSSLRRVLVATGDDTTWLRITVTTSGIAHTHHRKQRNASSAAIPVQSIGPAQDGDTLENLDSSQRHLETRRIRSAVIKLSPQGLPHIALAPWNGLAVIVGFACRCPTVQDRGFAFALKYANA